MADAPPPRWPPSEQPPGRRGPTGSPPGAEADAGTGGQAGSQRDDEADAGSIWHGRPPGSGEPSAAGDSGEGADEADDPSGGSGAGAPPSSPPPPQWPPSDPSPPPAAGPRWPAPALAPPSGPWAQGPSPAPPGPWAQPPAGGAPPWGQPPAAPPAYPAPPAPPGWGQAGPGPVAPRSPESDGNPWLVVFTVSLAVIVLALVFIGLRAAAGPDRRGEVVEVPRWSAAPGRGTTTAPSGTSPSTTAPANPGSSAPALDTSTPRLQVTDADGQFTVTVPRNWVNVPTPEPDQTQWVPFVQEPSGVTPTEFLFVVRWAPSNGCPLQRCAEEVVQRLKANSPGVSPTTANDAIGNEPAVRIEVTTPTVRLIAWVVVKGDRYWVPQLRGPTDGFDEFLVVAKRVVSTMTFG